MNQQEWQTKGAGHRQRLREKYLELGIDAFSDAEVLELILTLGTPRRDCKEIARAVIVRFGSLAGALEASEEELRSVKGIGASNGFAIHLVHGVARRYLEKRLAKKEYIRSSGEVADFLIHSMRDLEHEVFKVIFLDAGHGIIATETVAQGTITQNTIYPREIVKRALGHNAAAMVAAHNHPSGNLTPSQEDKKLTRNLFLACSLMHINFLDHLIIAGSQKPFSFADHGLMEGIRKECMAVI